MLNYLSTVVVLVCTIACWTAAGLGFVAALAPRARKIDALLLAPLVGMTLLFLVGLFQLTVLLIPLTPRFNASVLIALSLGLAFIYRRTLAAALRRTPRRSLWIFAIPVTYLLVFASLFHKEGLHLLVGSSDQLQYCQNARHMLEEMHTGSALDVPIPRQDFYLQESATRFLTYLKMNRRGAETLVASMARLTGLSYEETLPVVVLCSSFNLGLALAFLGRVAFRLRPFGVFALQAALLGSFILLLLHVQGAIALLLSIPLFLTVLALLLNCVATFSWRASILAGLILAGCVADYADPAIAAILAPSALIIVVRFFKGMRAGITALKGMTAAYVVACCLAPMGAYSVAGNAALNFESIYHSFVAKADAPAPVAAAPVAPPPPGPSFFNSPVWGGLQPILGFVSYYDTSLANYKISQYFVDKIWLGCLIFAVLGSIGIFGYLRRNAQVGLPFAALLMGWMLVSCICAHSQDPLRCHRAIQYSIPYLFVGLVLAASRGRGERPTSTRFGFVSGATAKLALIAFMAVNLYTCTRTVLYLNERDSATDPTVLRFNDRALAWRRLHDVIAAEPLEPILYSGFKTDTTRPFMIASALRDRPQVLGGSITRYWLLLGTKDVPRVIERSEYNTRLTQAEFDAEVAKQGVLWSIKIPELVSRSRVAIVPLGHGYPEEWIDSKEMFAARRLRFKNMCDVIYRGEQGLTFAPLTAGPLESDGVGSYFWPAKETGPITVVDADHELCELAIVHEGKPGDIAVRVGDKPYVGIADSATTFKITAPIQRSEQNQLILTVNRPTKIRSVTWTPE